MQLIFSDSRKITSDLLFFKISINEGVKKILFEINYWKAAPVWTPNKIKDATKDSKV